MPVIRRGSSVLVHYFRRLGVGLRRHPVRTAVEAATAYVFLWGLAQPAVDILKLPVEGWRAWTLLTIFSLLAGVVRAVPRQHLRRRVGASNTYVVVKFGDLFAEKGLRAVPVNEFFDSTLGTEVSVHSIHGKLIAEQFASAPELFETTVDEQLRNAPSQIVPRESARGRTRQYPVGTAAVVRTDAGEYLTFVLSHTDVTTLKASASVADLWSALAGLWHAARNACGGKPLVVPLVGGGLSGVGLPPQHLLSLLVISAVDESKRRQICTELVIVIPPELFSEIDLSAAIHLVM